MPIHHSQIVLSFDTNRGIWDYGNVHGSFNLSLSRKISKRETVPIHLDAINDIVKAHSIHRSLPATLSKNDVEQVWFPVDDELILAWRVVDRGAAMGERKVMYIDADSGDVLHIVQGQKHDQGLVYPPDVLPKFGSAPPLTTLLDVLSQVTRNNGLSIRGKDFQSSNACRAYACSTSASNASLGTCNELESFCVDPTPNMTKGKDYFTTDYYFATDAKYMDFDRDWEKDGYANSTIIMKLEDAPVFAPRLKKPANGIWGSDTDFSVYTGTETNDAFSELQTYHFMTLHSRFMKGIESFISPNITCLIGTDQNCTNIDPVTMRRANDFTFPIRFAVNFQSIDIWSRSSKYPPFLDQIAQGRGKNMSSPVLLDQVSDFNDAYFIFGDNLDISVENDTRDCSQGSCLSILNYPLTHFVFGQSSSSDWGLNACIVYHELTHAYVAKYIPNLPSFAWTSQGLSSEPGALNEAWADYFAAVNCGISDFRKTYNGHPVRNLNNVRTCKNLVGEVHAGEVADIDSLIFSGALWSIRKAIPATPPLNATDQELFDKLVFRAMTLGQSSDNFFTQATILLGLIRRNERLSVLSDTAVAEFDYRIFGCEHRTDLEEASDITFFLPDSRLSTSKLSTAPTQLVISPRRSDWGARFEWKQWFNSPLLGPLYSGYGRSSLKFAMSKCEIVAFSNTNSSNLPVAALCADGQPAVWTNTSIDTSKHIGYIDFLPWETPYIWIANDVPASMVMFASSMTLYGFNRIWRITLAVLGTVYTALGLFMVVTAAVFRFSRERYCQWVGELQTFQWLMTFVSMIFQSASGTLCIFALYFKIVRELNTQLAFAALFVGMLCDAVILATFKEVPSLLPRIDLHRNTDPFRMWWALLTVGWLLMNAFVFGMVRSTDASVPAHAASYPFYIAVWMLRCIQLTYLVIPRRPAQAQISSVIELEEIGVS